MARNPMGVQYDGHQYGNGTDTATSGANTVTHYHDRMGIKAAIDENIFSQAASQRNMPKRYGKTYKVSKWLHILDDDNVNAQGLGREGDADKYDTVDNLPLGEAGFKTQNRVFLTKDYANSAAASDAAVAYEAIRNPEGPAVVPTAVNVVDNTGNQYGSSRDVGYVATRMPTLAEGASAVNRVGVTKVTIETSLKRYGNYLEYDDEVELFSEEAVQIHYKEELGYMAGQVQDDLVQIDMLNAAGIVGYTGTATARNGISDIMAGVAGFNLIRKVEKQLFVNKAKKTTSVIGASTKITTTPINAGWTAYIDSDVKYDLESVVDTAGEIAWIPSIKYASAGSLMKGEVGAIHDTRFIEAPRMMHWAGAGSAGVDVHAILYVTPVSFATVGLQGENKIMFKSKAPGKADSTDVYGLRGFFSYNFFYASIALQPEKIARIECAAS